MSKLGQGKAEKKKRMRKQQIFLEGAVQWGFFLVVVLEQADEVVIEECI